MGTWSLLVVLLISCVASLEKKCPSNILNKFLSNPSMAKEHYDNGETISVTCLADSGDDGYDYFNYDGNDGLDAKNIRVLNCTDGKWIGHYPKCFSNCSKPDIYAILNPEYEVYAPGDNVIITACKKDNARIEGNTTLICMADGTWIGSAKCPKQHNSCNKQPPTISNAYITDAVLDEYKHGTVLRYKCSQAFDQMVKHSVTCNDGHWIPDSANLTICIIGHCSHIDSREIGYMHVKKISGQVGTYAEFECHDGYELDGSANILCMADRKWYPEIPKCKPISCPPPKQILNGRLLQEAYNGLLNIYQSTIRYDCDMGYRIVGPRFRKCQSDRTWSGNNTKCEEIVCEIPSPPENGTVYFTDDSQKVGSQIEYICDEHHIMEPKASKFAICTVHGHWSSPQPRCIKRCFIEPPINLEYFIGQEKVLENYIHSGTEMNARCSNRTELFRFSSYLEREQVSVKCNFGKLEPESLVCKDKRCNIITAVDNGHFRNSWKVFVTGEKIQSGTYIQLKCSEGYELHIKTNSMYLKLVQTDIKCYQGSFTTEIPSCEPKRCFIEPTTNLEYFIRQEKVLENYIHSGIVMNARCSNRTELFVSSSYLEREQVSVKCNLGKLEPESPVCKDKRCNIIATINNGHFINSGKVVVKGEKILSGSNIKLICFEGYELYNKTNSTYLDLEQTDIKCYQGSFTSETSTCVPKRCLIEPPVNMEYFIEGKKVLHKYIDNGTIMQPRCPDRMGLVLSSSYLDNEQTFVQCILGTLEPRTLECKGKMCKTIDLTREISGFIVSETKTKPGEFVPHNQSIQIVCGEGYRPHGILTCNAGIWMGNSTCELGCVLKDPGMHFISLGNRTVLNVGENANVSCKFGYQIVSNTSATPADQYDYDASEVSDGNYTCRDSGKWEPEIRFSCKQMCQTIDVAREITGFIVSETKTTPGEFVPHNQSIETVCGEGYRRHGVLTCNAGIWMGNSTCEPDVTRCVLKERGMHFISLGNRTELQVGENAKVSCKFGYQIVPIISAKGSYEYYYPDSESTADPSEMQETEDNENLITVSDRNYTCIDNGKWEPEIRFSCTQIMCDSFDKNNLENGNIIYSTHDGYSVGTVVSFQCNPGYTRHGPENRTCQIDGTWSGQCVTCQRDGSNASITCPAPCVPVGARKTGSFTYEIGSKVEISCTRSKTQDGGDRRIIKHCIKNGEYASWNGTMINCKEIICAKGDHYGFENGKVTYSSSVTTVFTEASFTCNPGYNLHGPMIRICQKNGTWSGECVTCQKHQPNSSTCPAPCIPDGAIRNGSLSDEIGSRIQLYCFESNMNYSVENSYIRHCVNDGKSASWNGTNINCKAKCKPLTDTYKVVKTGVVPGILSDKTVVELICNGSLEEVRAECRNGHWHPKKPTCKSKCEPLSDTYKVVKTGVLPRILSDKTVVELNCTGSLAKVQAECRNGQWHPKKPTCKRNVADTCSLSAVEGTLYNYKETKEKVFQGPIKSDRQIKVTCKDGFLPNTQNYDVSRCVNGVWKPEIVKCEKTDNF